MKLMGETRVVLGVDMTDCINQLEQEGRKFVIASFSTRELTREEWYELCSLPERKGSWENAEGIRLASS